MKAAVFVSGRGSNLEAILNSKELFNKISVALVLSDKTNCGAFEIAEKNKIPFYTIGEKENCIKQNQLTEFLIENKIDLIVLAGYLKLIPVELIKNYNDKIINIHPALLPAFGGKGMYGMNVHKAVFESSAQISGATVHFVNEEYDKGKIIAQQSVDISDVNSPEEIADKVLKVEHKILPFVLKKFAENKIVKIGERIKVLP